VSIFTFSLEEYLQRWVTHGIDVDDDDRDDGVL